VALTKIWSRNGHVLQSGARARVVGAWPSLDRPRFVNLEWGDPGEPWSHRGFLCDVSIEAVRLVVEDD
jgi:hypothetical protein